MTQNLNIIEVEKSGASGAVKHCHSCFRNDLHFNVPIPPFIFGFLLIASCGLICFVRPSRCVCCGKVRVL